MLPPLPPVGGCELNLRLVEVQEAAPRPLLLTKLVGTCIDIVSIVCVVYAAPYEAGRHLH
jgi:hypothetical protein